MKALSSLLPLGLVLVVVAGLVWWSMDRESGAAAWLVAAVLFGHGWVHLVFLLPVKEEDAAQNPFDLDGSWLVGQGASPALVRAVGAALAVFTFLALAAAAFATLGWVVPVEWWSWTVVAGAIGSTLLLLVAFAPLLVLGFVINAGLLLLALQSTYDVPR